MALNPTMLINMIGAAVIYLHLGESIITFHIGILVRNMLSIKDMHETPSEC